MSQDFEQPTDDRDDVGRLVRIAGKRQAVPSERAQRVRAAVHAEWRAQTDRRTVKRRVAAAASLAAAAMLVLAISWSLVPRRDAGAPASGGAVVVESLVGPAWQRSSDAETMRSLGIGDTVVPGSEIGTASDGRASLRLDSGHSVRLDRDSRLQLVADGSLALDRGAVYVDSGLKESSPSRLEVATPHGIVRETGTQYEVRILDAGLRIRLREGSVLLQRDEYVHEVNAGTELEIDVHGNAIRGTVRPDGPEWGWAQGVAPMFDLEGRSAREFLDWVARERGWELTFADENLERSAEEIVLGGTVARLTVEQALDAVLPTCGMSYRIDDATFVVTAAGNLAP